MPDVEDYEWDKPQSDEGAAERFVRAMASERLLWAPGGGWRYSNNMAFDALGDVIAKVSGQSFETYVRANILEPLGMKNSSFIHAEIGEALRTTGHVGNPARVSAVYPYNRRHAPSSIGGTRIGVGAADEGFFSGCGLPNRAMLRPPAPRPHGLAFPDVKTPVIWRVSAAAANREATMDQESLRLFTQRRKTEPTISSGFSYKARATLIGQNDLSSAAREALEFQGGELGSHFEATLTKQVAEELLGKCTELGLWVAAMALRTELKRSK